MVAVRKIPNIRAHDGRFDDLRLQPVNVFLRRFADVDHAQAWVGGPSMGYSGSKSNGYSLSSYSPVTAGASRIMLPISSVRVYNRSLSRKSRAVPQYLA